MNTFRFQTVPTLVVEYGAARRLGSLLRELQDSVTLRPEPWRLLPLVVLIVVISSFQILLNKQEVRV